MNSIGNLWRAIAGIFKRPSDLQTGTYQLWLEETGEHPQRVLDHLNEDWAIGEGVSEIRDLPWMMLELPADSDTFSVIQINAGKLETLGARVTVRHVEHETESSPEDIAERPRRGPG